MDNNTRMTLWRQVQESYVIDQYLADIENIITPSGEISFVSSMGSPKRTFDYAVFPLASYPVSEVISFAEANPALFSTIRLSSITVNTEREARQIHNSISNGIISFEDAAQNHSQDWASDRGGDMGSFQIFDLSWLIGNEEAQESIMNLAAGEMTDVLRMQNAWAFYKVSELSSQIDVNDLALQERVRSYLMQNLRGRVEDWVMSEAERFSALAREVGFDAAIAAEGMTKGYFWPGTLEFRQYHPVHINIRCWSSGIANRRE
jgi:hypothetical protein